MKLICFGESPLVAWAAKASNVAAKCLKHLPTVVSSCVYAVFRHIAPKHSGIIDHLRNVGRIDGIVGDAAKNLHNILTGSEINATEKAVGACFSPATTC